MGLLSPPITYAVLHTRTPFFSADAANILRLTIPFPFCVPREIQQQVLFIQKST